MWIRKTNLVIDTRISLKMRTTKKTKWEMNAFRLTTQLRKYKSVDTDDTRYHCVNGSRKMPWQKCENMNIRTKLKFTLWGYLLCVLTCLSFWPVNGCVLWVIVLWYANDLLVLTLFSVEMKSTTHVSFIVNAKTSSSKNHEGVVQTHAIFCLPWIENLFYWKAVSI